MNPKTNAAKTESKSKADKPKTIDPLKQREDELMAELKKVREQRRGDKRGQLNKKRVKLEARVDRAKAKLAKAEENLAKIDQAIAELDKTPEQKKADKKADKK